MANINPDLVASCWGFSGVTGEQVREVLKLSTEKVLGADMAPRHSALVSLLGEEIVGVKIFSAIDTTEWTVEQRFDRYFSELRSFRPGLIALEDYSFQRSTSYNSHETILIAENAALFKLAAAHQRAKVLKVAVPRVKSFVRRVQQFDKKFVIEFCQTITAGWVNEVSKNRRGQVKMETLGDVCDSLTLALCGAFALALQRNPHIMDPFPAPFVRMFKNPEVGGMTDLLEAK